MNSTGRILLSAALFAWSGPSLAQEQFNTPEEAVDALVGAAKTGDAKAILAVLGPDGQAIISSGDPVADTNVRQNFIAAYDAKHAIELEGNGTQTLILGNDDWPFPIPLANKAGEWQFDTKEGLDEILRRRVGRNELSTIQVALAYVQAQNEYAALDPAGLGHGVYAQRIVSHPGKKGRTLSADNRGRDAEPARRPRRGSFGRGLQGRRQADPLSRLLLPHPHAAGRRRSRRRLRLSGEGQDERRLRAHRCAGGIRQFRHHDLHGQSRRHGIPEGSWAEHDEGRSQNRRLRAGSGLDQSRLVPPRQAGNKHRSRTSGQGPVWVKSGLSSQRHSMTALPAKADIPVPAPERIGRDFAARQFPALPQRPR